MAQRGFVTLGLLIICVIAMLFFKRGTKEEFVVSVYPVFTVSTFAGSGTSAFANGTGTDASFKYPYGLAINKKSGNLFVADYNDNRIREITPSGVVSTFAGSGVAGNADGPALNGATFNLFQALVFDRSGDNLYVADSMNHRIRKIVIATGEVSTLAGSTFGFAEGIEAAAKFYRPYSITIDRAGNNLYVADTGNNRIRKIVIATKEVSTLVGSTSGFVDTTPTTTALFNYPTGITIDPSDNFLYVTDSNNNSIRKIEISTKIVSTFTVSPSGATDAMNKPQAITIDDTGENLYVCDVKSVIYRIKISTKVVSPIAGSYGSNGNINGPGLSAKFYSPNGIAIDSFGNLFVADSMNRVIRKLSLECPTNTTSVTIGGNITCIPSCPTMRKPPNTQGSSQAMLIALNTCATNTFDYNNNGVIQQTNPCSNSFYDFDQKKCLNALGTDVGTGLQTPCSPSTVYSSSTNACVPVRVIVKPGDPQLSSTTGNPGPNDFRGCKTVDKGDCTILFRNSSGAMTTTNPCKATNKIYNFATSQCVRSPCCNYTDPLRAVADKSCAADTALVINKNTQLCPANSRNPLCCNNAYATNSTCIKQNYWTPSYTFTPSHNTSCSGFQDYQGMYLLNKRNTAKSLT